MSQYKKKPNSEKANLETPKTIEPNAKIETPINSDLFVDKHRKFILPTITFLISIISYSLTFARTVTLVDSGELILTSAKLGVAHPPGTPLYTIFGYLFSKLPFGSIAARISFMSAIFAAIASAFVTLIAINIYDIFIQNSPSKSTKKTPPQKPLLNTLILSPAFKLLMPVAIGLTFAFSTTLWFYASVAEVYSLNICFLSIIIYLILQWQLLRLQGELTKSDKIIPLAAFIYGLALGVHHVTILLTLPAIACFVVYTTSFKYLLSRPVKIAFITVLIGFSVYIYLPLAASQNPILNWGNPSSLERFFWHISAKQYRVNFSPSIEIATNALKYFAELAFWQFTPLGLGIAFIGFVALWKRQPSIFYLLSLIIIFDIAYSFCYEIAEDKDAYYLTTNLALSIAIIVGIFKLFEILAAKGKSFTAAMLVIISLLPILNFATHYKENNKRNYLIARDFVENTMLNVEPNGLLLTLEWQFYSPYMYMRHLENFRRDAIVVDIHLLRRSWYINGYLKQEYPEMMAACAKEAAEFLEDVNLFETDSPYDVVKINTHFLALINSMIKYGMSRKAAYMTLPVDPPNVGEGYNWVPQGLAMRLYEDKTFHSDVTKPFQLRGLLDNSVYLDEVTKNKVIPAYAAMIANRAKYLSIGKQYDEAIELLLLSLKLKPDFDRAYQFLADVYVGKGNKAEAQRYYNQALALNPNNQAAKNGLQQLATSN